MKVLCTICARGNSQGLRSKNIKKINGFPLIKYTIDHAIKSKLFEDILVSTDDERIASLSKKFGVKNIIDRPKKLASNTAGKLSSIKHALKSLEAQLDKKYDVVIDLDVTSPLRNVSDIRKAYKIFTKHKASILLSATPSRKNPYFNQVLKTKKGIRLVKPGKKYYRRQDAPKVYDLNASIYIFRRSSLVKSNTIYTNKSFIYLMPEERSIDIDNMSDFHYVEYLMKKRKKN